MSIEVSVPQKPAVIHPIKVSGIQYDITHYELGKNFGKLRLDQLVELLWGIFDGYVKSEDHICEEHPGIFASTSKIFVLYFRLAIMYLTRRYRIEKPSMTHELKLNPESNMVNRDEH